MALPIDKPLFFLLLIFFSLNVSSCLALRSDFYRLRLFGGVGWEERKVGGRTEVEDVGSNAEVQDLGRFSVEEYNRSRRGGGGERLTFSKVVEAQRQVVSGIKYYLRVAARDADGERRTFDAVVVVRSWVKAKELVSFTPSAAHC